MADYTGTGDLSGAVPVFYNKKFLERLVQKGMPAMEVVTKTKLPEGNGVTAYWARMTNNTTTLSALRIQFSAGREPIGTENVTSAQISGTVEKYGYAVGVNDVTKMAAINDTITETVQNNADQAAISVDKRILEEAYGTSATATGAGFSMFFYNTAGAADAGTSTSAGFTYAGTTEYAMAASTIRAAVGKMRTRVVPTFEDGFYRMLVHPNTSLKLQADTTYGAAYVYTDPSGIRSGEPKPYAGTLLIEDSNIKTSANGSNGATLYYSVLVGKGALGATELLPGVKSYTVSGADKYDPIDEVTAVGWKVAFASARLNVSSGLIIVTADGNI